MHSKETPLPSPGFPAIPNGGALEQLATAVRWNGIAGTVNRLSQRRAGIQSEGSGVTNRPWPQGGHNFTHGLPPPPRPFGPALPIATPVRGSLLPPRPRATPIPLVPEAKIFVPECVRQHERARDFDDDDDFVPVFKEDKPFEEVSKKGCKAGLSGAAGDFKPKEGNNEQKTTESKPGSPPPTLLPPDTETNFPPLSQIAEAKGSAVPREEDVPQQAETSSPSVAVSEDPATSENSTSIEIESGAEAEAELKSK